MIGLGLAGGLTPSPTALLVLLGATASGRPWTGVIAVLAFGVGMAVTLTAVGLAVGLLGERSARWRDAVVQRLTPRRASRGRPAPAAVPPPRAGTRWRRLLPLTPSLAVVAAGGVLTARALLTLTLP